MPFVDFVRAFDTVPRKMLFKVLAHLGLPPQRVDIVRLFHENNVSLPGSGSTRWSIIN